MLIGVRLAYTEPQQQLPLKITTWDALGYYLYLPARFIYEDEKELKWFPAIDSTWSLSGGEFYQAMRQKNGHYVFKYLGGVACMQLPFFALAHLYAKLSHYPSDGFSLPYQVAIAIAVLCYCILSLFLLRIVLLRFFDDRVTAITLCLLTLASNFIQYVSVDSAQSHGFIFPLYVLMLWLTIKWHEKPARKLAFFIGFVLGLAAISRPTEGVMLFIPLLWKTRTRAEFQEKIRIFSEDRMQLNVVFLGLILAISPQLFYWKRVTGSWVFDVGSKWDFLNPHFRVLIGWEKGWLIYTPVAIFFLAGLLLIRKAEYGRAVRVFCLLNIYIIIAWHIWQYGASYSCRALVQSYPVFALPLAAVVQNVYHRRWRILAAVLGVYFIFVNAFQLWQYNKTILHYDSMNFAYYRAIYLNAHPTALTMSLLDTDEMIKDESHFTAETIFSSNENSSICTGDYLLTQQVVLDTMKENWLRFDLTLTDAVNTWQAFVSLNTMQDTTVHKFRLFHAVADQQTEKHYAFYIRLPEHIDRATCLLKADGNPQFRAVMKSLNVKKLSR